VDYMLHCLNCGFEFDETSFCNACPSCGGIIEPVIEGIKGATPDWRYETLMRYHRFLPIRSVESIAGFERTRPSPLIEADVLADKLGFHKLLLKDETVMETGTMKDREGLLTIYRLMMHKIPGLVIASSGNAGISIAWYASLMKKARIFLFLPECSRARMDAAIQRFTSKDVVSVSYVEGSMDEAGDAAKEFAKQEGLPYGTGFRNYSRREGVKTLALEYLFEQDKRADWYVQGVAGALAVHAFYKVHQELGLRCPKLLGVQPAACSPFVDAYHDHAEELGEKHIPGEPVVVPEAPVLKVRKPDEAYPIIKKEIDETKGSFEKVSADEIRQALRCFYHEPYFLKKYQQSGIRVGLEASTALAGVIKLRERNRVKADETVLVNVSGSARPGDIPDDWWDAYELCTC